MSNPFEHNRAASEKTFTGRQDELQFIHRSFVQTLDGHPSHVMVYGDRGLGKTSLLNHLRDEYKSQKILFVQCSLGECGDMDQLTGAFLEKFSFSLKEQRGKSLSRELIEGIKRVFSKVKGVKIGTDGISFDFKLEREDNRVQAQLSTIIADLWGEIASDFAAFCIFFDELDVLAPDPDGPTGFVGKVVSRVRNFVKSPFITSFAFALRTIIETLTARNIGKVKFVISCLPPIKERLCAIHPALARSFEFVKLTEFGSDSIRELLQKGLTLDDNRKSATPEFEKLLAKYSDGIPYHVQLICHHAYDTDTDTILDAGDFRKALVQKHGVLDALNNKFYEDAFKRVCRVWKRAGDCLTVMAESGGQIGLDALHKRLGLKTNAVSTGVCNLRSHGYVAEMEQRGQYQLSSQLCRAWIFQYLMNTEAPIEI